MEYIKDWAVNICLCSVGCALIYYLAPKGSMEKPLKMLISIFLLSLIITPLLELKSVDFDDYELKLADEKQISQNAEEINSSVIAAFETLVKESVEELLAEAGYEKFEVFVYAVSDENDYVKAEKIEVVFDSLLTVKQEHVHNIVYNDTGIAPILLEKTREGGIGDGDEE